MELNTVSSSNCVVCYAAILIIHIAVVACASIHASVCLLNNSEKNVEKIRKTKIDVNIPRAGVTSVAIISSKVRLGLGCTVQSKPIVPWMAMYYVDSELISFLVSEKVASYRKCHLPADFFLSLYGTAHDLTLRYLTSGRACYYIYPPLRTYQFGPMHNLDVTKGHSNWL